MVLFDVHSYGIGRTSLEEGGTRVANFSCRGFCLDETGIHLELQVIDPHHACLPKERVSEDDTTIEENNGCSWVTLVALCPWIVATNIAIGNSCR